MRSRIDECNCHLNHQRPQSSEGHSEAVGSTAKVSDEAIDLATELAKKWWANGKISYRWDDAIDVSELAYVIDNKRML